MPTVKRRARPSFVLITEKSCSSFDTAPSVRKSTCLSTFPSSPATARGVSAARSAGNISVPPSADSAAA